MSHDFQYSAFQYLLLGGKQQPWDLHTFISLVHPKTHIAVSRISSSDSCSEQIHYSYCFVFHLQPPVPTRHIMSVLCVPQHPVWLQDSLSLYSTVRSLLVAWIPFWILPHFGWGVRTSPRFKANKGYGSIVLSSPAHPRPSIPPLTLFCPS